jgi:hypothetical protein
MNNRILFIAVSIFVIAFARILPHPFNVTPIAAIALFGGAMFSKRWMAFLIPMAAMLVSDIFIGFHNTMWAVYLSFGLTVLLGMNLSNDRSPIKIGVSSLAGSVLFFLITNFAVWYGDTFYTQDLAGLMTSYAAGVPFFRNGILGDLFFNLVLFGGYQAITAKFPKLAATN